jgi:multicomponent Na+:H+ antiporter subunit G
MDIIIIITSGLCLFIGSFLCISGGIGILRFPDFYTRMHAAGVTDTLGSGMILIGLMVLSTDFLVFAKLVMVLLLTLLVGPTTSHVLAKAALHNGLTPKIDQGAAKKNVLEPRNHEETTSSNL